VAIRKFLLFSIMFHLVLFLGMYFVPETKIKKAKEFVTSLVTPEEAKRPVQQPRALLKPMPVPRARTVRPLIPRPNLKDVLPLTPPSAKSLPSPEKPVVPGEGMTARKPPKNDSYRTPGEGPEGGRGKSESEREDAGRTGKFRPSDKPGYLDRERMFDRGVVDQIAKKDPEVKKVAPDNPITFDTKEYKLAGYMTQLRQKIESIWVYPPEAAAHGIYGDLKIMFTIKKDGRLGAVELVRTSGHKMLDDAAMKALKDGEPYWPLPDSWGKDSYTILGHFVYVYGGYYIK
jgi:protein TonB